MMKRRYALPICLALYFVVATPIAFELKDVPLVPFFLNCFWACTCGVVYNILRNGVL